MVAIKMEWNAILMQAVTWVNFDIRPDVEARHERLWMCCVILLMGDV